MSENHENHENHENENHPAPVLPPGALAPTEPTPIRSLKLAKRFATFALPSPYEMFTVTAWVNAPLSQLRSATTEEGRMAILRQIVKTHDIPDFEGNPYPDGSTNEFWEAIPDDVAAAIMQGVQAQVGKFPTVSGGR